MKSKYEKRIADERIKIRHELEVEFKGKLDNQKTKYERDLKKAKTKMWCSSCGNEGKGVMGVNLAFDFLFEIDLNF